MPLFYENNTTELRLHRATRLECARHLHLHVELVVVFEGHPIAILDQRSYQLSPGDVFLAFPNQVHGYQSPEEESSLLAIFSPGMFHDLVPLFAGNPPLEPVLHNIFADPLLAAICQAFPKSAAVSACEKATVKGLLLTLLSRLLEQFDLSQAPIKQEGDIFSGILHYCMNNYMNDIHLSDVASALHVCKFHISHLINQRMNMNFNEYINSIRISQAEELLLSREIPITEISHRCGFNSTRTFNRAFQKQIGCTPREYRMRN